MEDRIRANVAQNPHHIRKIQQITLMHLRLALDIREVVIAGGTMPASDTVDFHIAVVAHDMFGQIASAGPGYAGDQDFADLHGDFS
jgi:hypothetical protein